MARQTLEMLPPVRVGNVFEETMERLLRGIRLGQFPPASKLPPERELARALGVSRTTLREALAGLQSSGHVRVRRGRYGGTYVAEAPPDRPRASLDPAEVWDLLTLRRIVEPAACELAAARDLGADQRARVKRMHEDLLAAPAERHRPLDARLHIAIAELCGSPSVVAVVADVRVRVDSLLECIPLLPPNLEHSGRQHAAVVAAVLGGDGPGARQAMLDHLDGTAALLRGFLG